MIINILEWFLKDHVTEDWRNDAENSALPTQLVLQYLWTPASMQNLSLVLLRL